MIVCCYLLLDLLAHLFASCSAEASKTLPLDMNEDGSFNLHKVYSDAALTMMVKTCVDIINRKNPERSKYFSWRYCAYYVSLVTSCYTINTLLTDSR